MCHVPTQTAHRFLVLPSLIFVITQMKSFFFKLDQSLNPEKNMLILCPLKGFMHLFSSLLLSV